MYIGITVEGTEEYGEVKVKGDTYQVKGVIKSTADAMNGAPSWDSSEKQWIVYFRCAEKALAYAKELERRLSEYAQAQGSYLSVVLEDCTTTVHGSVPAAEVAKGAESEVEKEKAEEMKDRDRSVRSLLALNFFLKYIDLYKYAAYEVNKHLKNEGKPLVDLSSADLTTRLRVAAAVLPPPMKEIAIEQAALWEVFLDYVREKAEAGEKRFVGIYRKFKELGFVRSDG